MKLPSLSKDPKINKARSSEYVINTQTTMSRSTASHYSDCQREIQCRNVFHLLAPAAVSSLMVQIHCSARGEPEMKGTNTNPITATFHTSSSNSCSETLQGTLLLFVTDNPLGDSAPSSLELTLVFYG